jgi:peptide/nickel transport system permease protein
MAAVESATRSQRAQRPGADAWEIYRQSPTAMLGLVLVLLISVLAIIGPLVYPVDPFEIIWAPMSAPGTTERALLGTDYLGRDILAGLLVGAKSTLIVGLTAAALTVIIGLVIGALAGFYLGMIDEILMRVTEFFQVLPPLLFAMVLVTMLSPSLWVVAVSIGVVSWPPTARLARAEFLRIRNLEYVTASRASGVRQGYIIWRVILPNALPPLIVSATLTIGTAILFEAGLSFLGLSDPNVMSWGLMIGSGREYMLDAWWIVTLPGVMIFLAVLGVSLVGDGLNDAFNPKLRRR